MKTFSPTEMPHGRYEQGGIGVKCRQGYSASSGREMEMFWHHCQSEHQIGFKGDIDVQITSPPLLQIIRQEL